MTAKPQTGGKRSFPKWRYLTFSVSDVAYSLLYFWVVSFLTIYYTDVFQISAAAVSVMLLVVRIYDAVIDPFIGGLMDNKRGKMGRFRPWILIGGVCMVATVILMFWAHPNWSAPWKIAYMYLTYILCCTAMSVFYMAYGALGGTISADSMVRTRANSVRFTCSGAGSLAIGYFVPSLLALFGASSLVRGYLVSVVICGAIALPLVLVTTFGTKEVIYPAEGVKPPFRKQFKALLSSKPMLIIACIFFLQGASYTFRMTSATYYFTYVTGDLGLFSTYSLLQSAGSIVGALTAPMFYKLCREKSRAMFFVLLVTALCLFGMRVTAAPGALFFVLVAIGGYSLGAVPTLSYSMVPDVVDDTQDREGLRADAFMAAIGSFTFQCGMAVSGAAVGFVLKITGYLAGAEQNPATLTSITNLMTIVPGILIAVMAVLMANYPLDEKKHDAVLASLRQKRLI